MNAYFVLGAESTGTRMLTEILIKAGCFGDATDRQRLDEGFANRPERIAFRRSVPHDKRMPNIGRLTRAMEHEGYVVRHVIMTRDWNAVAQSQVLHGHSPDYETALGKLRAAYRTILGAVGADYLLVSYEALLDRRGYLLWLLSELGLPPVRYLFTDANRKHYR